MRELFEAGRPATPRGLIEGLLVERHDGRGTPHRWTLEDQITTAARGLEEERRLRRAGRLSRDDHERIEELMQVVRQRLTDAAAEVAFRRDDAHEEHRRQAAARLAEANAHARETAEERDEQTAEMQRRLDEAESRAEEREAACRRLDVTCAPRRPRS